MSRMKLITLTLALLATLLVFTACGNPISEIVHGDPPQGEISQTPHLSPPNPNRNRRKPRNSAVPAS